MSTSSRRCLRKAWRYKALSKWKNVISPCAIDRKSIRETGGSADCRAARNSEKDAGCLQRCNRAQEQGCYAAACAHKQVILVLGVGFWVLSYCLNGLLAMLDRLTSTFNSTLRSYQHYETKLQTSKHPAHHLELVLERDNGRVDGNLLFQRRAVVVDSCFCFKSAGGHCACMNSIPFSLH